jgi:alkylated DNA repair dioxygenase AlkB
MGIHNQLQLFEAPVSLPEGFRHAADLISIAEERSLLDAMRGLPFREFEFQGFLGKRRVVSFGWKYDFNTRHLQRSTDIPEFLLPIRERAAQFAGMSPDAFQQVLLTHYPAGASIGWHKDKAVFGEVIGISLASPCTFRFRRKAGQGWERVSMKLAPGSVYLLQGPSRIEWEHSIPAVGAPRYSITFRNFKCG